MTSMEEWRDINYISAEIMLVIIGLFLFIDSIYWHAIGFDYSALNLQWLDPYISHGVIGLALMARGILIFAFFRD